MHIKSASRLREACEASSLNQLQVVHRTTRNLEKNGRRFETLLLVARESKCLAHCSSTASSFASAGSPGRRVVKATPRGFRAQSSDCLGP